MKFQKGQARLPNAGRKKGSLNKKKLKKVSEILAESGIDPVNHIMNILNSGELKPVDELNGWFDLLSYCQAKPKEDESDPSEDDENLLDQFGDISNETLLELVKTPIEA